MHMIVILIIYICINLQIILFTCNFTILLNVVLHIKFYTTEQMLAHVFGIEGWKSRRSLLTEGNTVGVLVSGDSGTDHTLGYTE